MIIGITGGTGCGKTTLLNLIRQAGGVIVDCDALYHRLLADDQAMLEKIALRFPGTVINGQLDRKKLGSVVFADPQALQALNAITHPVVRQAVLALLTPEPELAAIDAIGLFEGGLAELCKLTVAVTAPREARIARLMKRDGISREYAQSRIDAQRTDREFSGQCDYTLENDGTQADFEGKCLAFLAGLGIITGE